MKGSDPRLGRDLARGCMGEPSRDPWCEDRYFCSAGMQATILSILELGMQSNTYTLTQITSNGFVATKGSGPVYEVDVSVPSAGNYSLRIYPPR